MCIALPMQITEKTPPHHGIAESGGISYKVNLKLLPEVEVGSYVIVHAGYAIEHLNEEEAKKNLDIFNEISDLFNP